MEIIEQRSGIPIKNLSIYNRLSTQFSTLYYREGESYSQTNTWIPDCICVNTYLDPNIDQYPITRREEIELPVNIRDLFSRSQNSVVPPLFRGLIYSNNFVFRDTNDVLIGLYNSIYNILHVPNIFIAGYEAAFSRILDPMLNAIENRGLTLDYLSSKIPDKQVTIDIGGSEYLLSFKGKVIKEEDNILEEYRSILSKMKGHYIEQLAREKIKNMEYRKRSLVMPTITVDDYRKYGVMVYRREGYYRYVFKVPHLIVDTCILENTHRGFHLTPPICFEDLLMYIDINPYDNKVDSVHLYKQDGSYPDTIAVLPDESRYKTGHFHVADGKVCVGSCNVLKRTCTTISEIVSCKDEVLKVLTSFNLDSAYTSQSDSLYRVLNKMCLNKGIPLSELIGTFGAPTYTEEEEEYEEMDEGTEE
jgi:hypothetical protein